MIYECYILQLIKFYQFKDLMGFWKEPQNFMKAKYILIEVYFYFKLKPNFQTNQHALILQL